MRLLLGVCGSIAAYKAAELVRLFQARGVEVHVALTSAAERFIAPLTFNALTGHPVHTSLWSPDQAQSGTRHGGEQIAGPIEHIAVAQAMDALLVAPCSATTLGRLAHGLAEDFLSATALASTAPLLLAPAMNSNMWSHPATQANLDLLRQRGATVIAPDSGYLACGMTGDGRLADLDSIVESTLHKLQPPRDLVQDTVLITAGGTREPLDPVRFLGNRSSGRMGHALADAARARGARVLLLTASRLPVAAGCEVFPVDTAGEMEAILQKHLSRATLVFGAAAVADFRPRQPSPTKLRRSGPLILELEPTPDLMAYAAAHRRPGALVVAFAAETGDLVESARQKFRRKGVDAVFANDIARSGTGFDAENNTGVFLTGNGVLEFPPAPKRTIADRLLTETLRLRDARDPAFQPAAPDFTRASALAATVRAS